LRFAAKIRDQFIRTFSDDGVLFGSVFDGAGEAQYDLLPNSEFLTALNARPHPADVGITMIAGNTSPIPADKVAARIDWLQRQLPEKVSLTISYEEVQASLNGVINGVGDGVVPLPLLPACRHRRLPGCPRQSPDNDSKPGPRQPGSAAVDTDHCQSSVAIRTRSGCSP